MATRSIIAIEEEDGSIRAVYCHFDGYPEYNGRILLDHYLDREKVRSLIDQGGISILGAEIGEPHSFERSDPLMCTFYIRDRGDDPSGIEPRSYSDRFALALAGIPNYGAEWIYIFTLRNDWIFLRIPYSGIRAGDRLSWGLLSEYLEGAPKKPTFPRPNREPVPLSGAKGSGSD